MNASGTLGVQRKVCPLNSTLVFESSEDLLDLTYIVDAVVVETSTVPREAAISSLVVPCSVLIVGTTSPDESLVVLLDLSKDIVRDAIEDTISGSGELDEDGDLTRRS